MTMKNIAFLFVLLAAASFFAISVRRLIRHLRIGQPENRFDHTWERI